MRLALAEAHRFALTPSLAAKGDSIATLLEKELVSDAKGLQRSLSSHSHNLPVTARLASKEVNSREKTNVQFQGKSAFPRGREPDDVDGDFLGAVERRAGG